MKTVFDRFVSSLVVLATSAALATGQESGQPAASPAGDPPAARAKVGFSDGARLALAAAKELALQVRGRKGAERAKACEAAAVAYDKVAVDFAAEVPAAAFAAWTAAELWRQQGSLALAEKDYLQAATLDAPRYAQRGLCGAADMQRRQKRYADALQTYQKAALVEPTSGRAQDARLWQARILQDSERFDEAMVAFQAALESADPGAETIEASNFLALAWVRKGDFDAAARAIEHAEQSVQSLGDEDPIVLERLRLQLEQMTAKKALQRARDKQASAGADAVQLEASRTDR